MEQGSSRLSSLTYDMSVNALEAFVATSPAESYNEPIRKRRLSSAQPKVIIRLMCN